MTGREKLKRGDFNSMSQKWQPDGSVEITLTKLGEDKVYRIVVKNLYEPNEVVLSDEIVKE